MQIPLGRSVPSSSAWPDSLRSHPIFDQDESQQQSQSTPQLGPQRKQHVVFRDSDILTASGSHIRITSLLDAKTPRAQRSYKTLHTPQVQFSIDQMVLNSPGQLLAVSNAQQVAIIVLPSSSRTASRNPIIETKSLVIGPYYYNAASSARIVKMEFHPLSEGQTSLFILTSDGMLREFDPTMDSDEPLQSWSFVEKKEKKAGSFSYEEPGSTEAISFTFGCGKSPSGARGCSDWTPLTVYGLMRNSDIFALCPICPSKLRVHPSYITSLEAYVRGKEALALNDASLMSSPVPEFHPTSSFSSSYSLRSSTSSLGGEKEMDLPTVYDHQRKYVTALSKQLSRSSGSNTPNQTLKASSYGLKKETTSSTLSLGESTISRSIDNKLITFNAPHTIKRPPEPQGPFRFSPAPFGGITELDDLASDILYLSPFSEKRKEEDRNLPNVGVMLVSFADGRIEVSLDLVKVEAIWSRPGTPANSPFLVMLETIDLEFAKHVYPPSSQALQQSQSSTMIPHASLPMKYLYLNHPLFVQDPIYGDTVYLMHNFGVHVVWMGWIDELRAAFKKSLSHKHDDQVKGTEGEEDDDASLRNLVATFVQRENAHEPLSMATQMVDTVDPAMRLAHPIVGLTISSDIIMDYAMLALATNHPAITFELPLRIPEPVEGELGLGSDAKAAIEGLEQRAGHAKALSIGSLGKSSDAVRHNSNLSSEAPSSTQSVESYKSYTLVKPFPNLPQYRGPPRIPNPGKLVVAKDDVDPQTLRNFLAAVVELSKMASFVENLQGTLEERLHLLQVERARELEVLRQNDGFLRDLLGRKDAKGKLDVTQARMNTVAGVQPHIVRKVDAILQKLMDGSNSELTAAEKEWFKELRRMARDVMASGDGSALLPKSQDLQKQLDFLMPELGQALQYEKNMKQEQEMKLGTKQMLNIGHTLGSQDAQIKEAVQRLQDLAERIGVSIDTAPSEQGKNS